MVLKGEEKHSINTTANHHVSRPNKGVITQGVFSLEESLESLQSLDSLESLENGWILLYFPLSGGSLKGGFSQISRISKLTKITRKWTRKEPFSKALNVSACYNYMDASGWCPSESQLSCTGRPTFVSLCAETNQCT